MAVRVWVGVEMKRMARRRTEHSVGMGSRASRAGAERRGRERAVGKGGSNKAKCGHGDDSRLGAAAARFERKVSKDFYFLFF